MISKDCWVALVAVTGMYVTDHWCTIGEACDIQSFKSRIKLKWPHSFVRGIMTENDFRNFRSLAHPDYTFEVVTLRG